MPQFERAILRSTLTHLLFGVVRSESITVWQEIVSLSDSFMEDLTNECGGALTAHVKATLGCALLNCGQLLKTEVSKSLPERSIAELTSAIEIANNELTERVTAEIHHCLVRAYTRCSVEDVTARCDAAQCHYAAALKHYSLARNAGSDAIAELKSDTALALLLSPAETDTEAAMAHLLDASEMCSKLANTRMQAEIQYRLGLASLYRSRGERILNCETAIAYFSRAEHMFRQLGCASSESRCRRDTQRAAAQRSAIEQRNELPDDYSDPPTFM